MRPLTRLVASGLLAAAVLLSPAASAQEVQAVPDLPDHFGNYEVVVGPDGTFVCVPADAENTDGAQVASGPVNLTVLPSLNAPEQLGGLRIILRATDQLLERPDALLAFRRAAARWERAILTPITVIYDIDYGPTRFGSSTYSPNTIASANSASAFAFEGDSPATVQQVVARMVERAADDPQLQALYNAIPDPLPSTAIAADGSFKPIVRVVGGQPTLQMLGYREAQLDPDPAENPFGSVPNLGFNSAFDFDFDPNDGTTSTLIDFEAIVIHEMGHSLGFTSLIGNAEQSYGVIATVWDLFRVRPDSVVQDEPFTDGVGWEVTPRVVTPGPVETETFMEAGDTYFKAVQVFYDGLHEYETSTATGGRQGGDGQQASHWRDDSRRPPTPQDDADRYIGIMDPNFGPGVRQLYKYPDLRVLETLGYDIDFEPTYATGFQLSIDGEDVRVDTLQSTPVQIGDVAVGTTTQVPVTITNPGSLVDLAFDVEVIEDAVYPEGTDLTTAFDVSEGVVSGAGSLTVNLEIGGSDAPAFFAGRLRFRTNFDSLLVVEVPIEYSVGGAVEPMLVLDGVPEDNDFGNLGDLGDGETAQIEFTISNSGNLPLEFDVFTQLTAQTFDFDTTPNDQLSGAGSSLAAFFGARAVNAAVLYSTDFEDQDAFDALEKGGSLPGDWQLVDGGAAALSGHSATRAAYFGQITLDGDTQVFQYQNQASGRLLLPELDLSGANPEDLTVVSFNYYLQAEEGFDFASVLYSTDGGETYETATTSDQGMLVNTDTGWTSVMVDVSAVAGLPDPVRFAFQFISDQSVTDEGWYIDDVQVATLEDQNPFYPSVRTGVIADANSPVSVTVTADGSDLEPGFYTGVVAVATNQRADDPAPFRVEFSAGDPTVPTLVPGVTTISRTVSEGQTEEVDLQVTNSGAAPLTYVRILEPALGNYRSVPEPTAAAAPAIADAIDVDLDEIDVAAGGPATGDDAVTASGDAVISLPTTFATAITQLPDGRVLVSNVGSPTAIPDTYIASEDLSSIEVIPGPTPLGNQILSVTYNDRTESLWYGAFQSGLVYEVNLEGSTLTRTGRTINVGFQVSGFTYSKALDAFLASPYQSDLIYAFDVDGNSIPGYPQPFFRGSSYTGVSISGGVLEVGYLDLFNSPAESPEISYIQYDQYLNLYLNEDGSPRIVVFDDPDVTAARTVRSFVRSRTNPDETMYLLTRGAGATATAPALPAKIVSINPPDLDPSTQTFVDALEPAFGNDLPAQEDASITFALRPEGAPGMVARDTVAFLTNSPAARVVTIPVEVSIIGGTSAEDGTPTEFAFRGTRPNPLRGNGQIEFDLPEAAAVTVSVFNTLGQRVAVLAANEPMSLGTHVLPFETSALAAGVYIVRVNADAYSGTQKVTVIR